MLHDEQYIIDALEIADWPEDKREPVIVEATMRIGHALLETLNDAQYDEYQAIIDDNVEVIDGWLEQNIPDYKDSAVYQEIVTSQADDPEQNNPKKLFATIAWIQKNVPDAQERISKILEQYKQELP